MEWGNCDSIFSRTRRTRLSWARGNSAGRIVTDADGVFQLEGTALSTPVTRADRLPRKGGMVKSPSIMAPAMVGGRLEEPVSSESYTRVELLGQDAAAKSRLATLVSS